MTDQPYVPPRWDAGYDELEAAADRLERVELTLKQFEGAPTIQGRDIAQLIAYCEAEGIEPADLAAHAIFARQAEIAGLGSAGLAVEDFEALYREIATSGADPIYIMKIEEDDELPRKEMFDPDQHQLFGAQG